MQAKSKLRYATRAAAKGACTRYQRSLTAMVSRSVFNPIQAAQIATKALVALRQTQR